MSENISMLVSKQPSREQKPSVHNPSSRPVQLQLSLPSVLNTRLEFFAQLQLQTRTWHIHPATVVKSDTDFITIHQLYFTQIGYIITIWAGMTCLILGTCLLDHQELSPRPFHVTNAALALQTYIYLRFGKISERNTSRHFSALKAKYIWLTGINYRILTM